MEITKEELLELLNGATRETYTFDQYTTFIKEQHITVESGANFYNGSQPKPEKRNSQNEIADQSEDDQIVSELLGIFYGDETEVRKFLKKVHAMKDIDICNLAKELVKEKKISELSCRKPLWDILQKHGIYKSSNRNWNKNM